MIHRPKHNLNQRSTENRELVSRALESAAAAASLREVLEGLLPKAVVLRGNDVERARRDELP